VSKNVLSAGGQRKLPGGKIRHELPYIVMRTFHGLNRLTFPNDSTDHSFGTQVFEDRAAGGFCLAIVRMPPSKSTSVAGIALGTTTVHRRFRKIPTLMACGVLENGRPSTGNPDHHSTCLRNSQSASSGTLVARPPILTLIYCQNDRAFAH
jgi:hypothetical protein